MPMLGKKVFVCSKPPTDKKPDEPVYTIPHTKEQFLSKKDYEKRLAWYKERIWTCQCTGHINLSHEEAWNSERNIKKTLKSQFPVCCEKDVLEIVHHSTVPLDALVDQAWLKLQQVLSVGEKVNLKVKSAGKAIGGVITKVDPAGVQANPTSNCSSPSSDKENCSSEGNSPKKWIPPKLLPYKYSVQLEEGDKIVNAIPADDLVRSEKPPSKDLVRYFIRANALRTGATTPWIVEEHLVKKYSIPRKFADFLLSPVKMSEGFKKAEEENVKKRKASTPSGPASKKAKIDKIKDKCTDNKKQTKLTKSPLKNSSLDKKHKDSPKKKSKSSEDSAPKLKKQISTDSSSSEDIPLSSLKNTPSKSKTLTKNGKSTPKKNTPSKKKDVINVDSDSDDDRPLSDVRPLSKIKSVKSPKKIKSSMKQMTLFDMKKKLQTPDKKKTPLKDQSPNKGLKTPEKKTRPDERMKTPIIVSKLVKAVKSEEEQKKINALVLQAAKMLTSPQRKRLPESVKEMVQSKYKKMEEQKKIDSMTPEQKAEYFRQKKLESKRRMREKQSEMRKRFEDQDLEQKALPQPKLVSTPDGLPNELFGDVAMVTEFISCYAGLLMPDDEYPIFTDALMKALCSGKEGFTYLSRVLVVLLQTLLQDQISEDYQEIKVPLSDIPVNPFTSSELVRLCLRKQDVDDGNSDVSDGSDDEKEEEEVPDDTLQLLETKELYQLEAEQKLQILKGLCLRIMGTYSVQDYMEEKQQTASKLWKRKMAELKQKNDQLKKEKEQKKEVAKNDSSKNDSSKPDENTKEELEKNALLSMFYGNSGEKVNDSRPSTPEITSAESTADEGTGADDLASIVKRRRLMTAKAAAEKEKIEQEKRKVKEKEYEQYRKQLEKEKFQKEFDEGIRLAKMVLRQSPIGTDRNHNRYWVFSATTPGLYIEKGWVTDEIEYTCNIGKSSNSTDDSDSSDDDSDDGRNISGDTAAEKDIETTVPHTGQNLWFTYDSVKDLDKLIECLHNQGYRESQLKAQLKKFYPIITKAINVAKRNNLELRDSNGDEEMVKSLKKELLETETRLRHGGLGGVEEFGVWTAKLESSKDVKTLAQCLLETEKYVIDKFREGIMKPKKKKVMEVKEETNEEEEDDEEEEKEEIIAKGILNWREAVENSSTYSRLHVLLGVLDASIKWEKSAENAKCKICRRKDDDATLLLCDECNQAFHMHCLRPALTSIPKGDWLCPACAPQRSRERTKIVYTGKSYKEVEEVSDSEENEEIEHEEKCVECGGDEELIFCAECPAAYHLECHEPPLRRPPRGQWSCNECKTGIKRSTRSKSRRKTAVKQKRAPPKRKQYKEESESDESEEEEESEEEDEESSEEESEDEDEETQEPPAKAPRRSQQQQSARQSAREKKSSPQSSRRSRKSQEKPIEVEEKPKSKRAPSDLSLCLDIINAVMKHPSSWPFLEAVSKRDVPDYHKIIKHPMDFQKIKDKLRCMVYGSVNEVVKDVQLIFSNSEEYNKTGSEVLQCTEELETYFSNLMKKDLPIYHYERRKLTNGFMEHDQPSKSRGRR